MHSHCSQIILSTLGPNQQSNPSCHPRTKQGLEAASRPFLESEILTRVPRQNQDACVRAPPAPCGKPSRCSLRFDLTYQVLSHSLLQYSCVDRSSSPLFWKMISPSTGRSFCNPGLGSVCSLEPCLSHFWGFVCAPLKMMVIWLIQSQRGLESTDLLLLSSLVSSK